MNCEYIVINYFLLDAINIVYTNAPYCIKFILENKKHRT